MNIAEQIDNLPKELQHKAREVINSTLRTLQRLTAGLDPAVRDEFYRLTMLSIQASLTQKS